MESWISDQSVMPPTSKSFACICHHNQIVCIISMYTSNTFRYQTRCFFEFKKNTFFSADILPEGTSRSLFSRFSINPEFARTMQQHRAVVIFQEDNVPRPLCGRQGWWRRQRRRPSSPKKWSQTAWLIVIGRHVIVIVMGHHHQHQDGAVMICMVKMIQTY